MSDHARFAEAVKKGRCFTVCNQTGVATQSALSATTPVLTLANPLGSSVDCILWFAGVNFLVVFAAVAEIWLAAGTVGAGAAVTGTKTTSHRNCLLGGGEPSVIPLLAATLPAAPVGISLLGAGLTGAVNLLPTSLGLERWFDGSVIIQPGTNISIQTGSVSGASGTLCEYIWEEVPR